VSASCSDELVGLFCKHLEFPQSEVSHVKGSVDMAYVFELIESVPMPQLRYPDYIPAEIAYESIFSRIAEGDMLVHMPYQSFKPVSDLIAAAADDTDVLAIKMTLYRVNDGSSIIAALKRAAENGKQVTVLVEIKARFDEERNIKWVRTLEDAGCHVIYGMVNMKVHAKIALIVRREPNGIKRYVHISTGNYNEKTARMYSDCAFFTAQDEYARDVAEVFNVITGYSVPAHWQYIATAPHDLRTRFVELIDTEIKYQKKYKNGFIFAKMNSLEDVMLVDKLYEASRAGVRIQLLVRGICVLIPGLPGLSSTIEVRSIVGRFLEHSRIFMFNNNGSQRVFMSSADWMRRNCDARIEIMFELVKESLRDHVIFILNTYWKDTMKARMLTPEKTYIRPPHAAEPFNAQEYLLAYYRS
jgi:polyphosphate kinase